MDRLMADYAKHPQGGDVAFIPNRVHRLVNDAITAACEKYGVYP
ncbi:MAG: hypothetical protein GOVbin2937_76 [Prokaryotic dsDNA virus sp.]|nr:MAG: hypothetical protein GOVbin2937_76 [Prokaryotic dsDNA virus sp.]